MTAAALSLLAATAVVAALGRIPVLRRPWGAPLISILVTGMLAAAALCARAAGQVTGAAQVAAYVLTVLAAALCADPVVRAVFALGIGRRRPRTPDEREGAHPQTSNAVTAGANRPGAAASGTEASGTEEHRADRTGEADRPGPLRGGLTIGVLERTAVAASVLAGWPGGIAVVMAVKGLARYPELREPDASEQFIIGTFTSVLFSLAVAGVGILLTR